MALHGLVEPPVFGTSEASVPGTLVPGVLPAGAVGCYLHDEVGRLALIEDDIAVAVLVGPRFPDDVSLAGGYGGFRVAEVLDQVVAAAVRGHVL